MRKLIDRRFIFAIISEILFTLYALKVNMNDVQFVIGFGGIVGGYFAVRYFSDKAVVNGAV